MTGDFQRRFRLCLPYLLLAVVFLAGGVYIFRNLGQFRQIKITSWWWLAAILVSCLGQALASALVFQRLLGIFKLKLGFLEAVGLVYLTAMGSYFVPYVGGMGMRAAYLKKKYGFPLSYFASTVGGTAVLSIAINALVGLLLTVYIFSVKGIISPVIIFIFLGCFILPGLAFLIPARRLKNDIFLVRKLNRVWEGWEIISRRPRDIVVLAGFIFLTVLCGVLAMYCAFRAMSGNIAFVDTAVVYLMSALSALANITPAGLGISELVIVFTSRAFGYLIAVSLSAALIIRVISTIIVFAAGGIASYAFSRSIARPPEKSGSIAGIRVD